MLDPIFIIKTVGLVGIFFIIFAESGLFFGFFFPGDTLLFAAGILASQGFLSLSLLIIGCVIAAIIGDNVGYWTGKHVGRKLFDREATLFFNKKNVDMAERFYNRHGPITVIAARFIPFIRTFAPIVAGVAKMQYKKFFLYNVIGGLLWSIILPVVGYYFGGIIPNSDKYFAPIAILIICLSFLPIIIKSVIYFIYRKMK
jgi:membrane-associated protein